MQIVTMATLKGGTGKTMNTFNIAGILAETKKILLIDADPQCNLTNNCGVDSADLNILTIRDIIANPPSKQPVPDEVIIKSPIEKLNNLDLIPSSILLFKTEKELASRSNREHIISQYIDKNRRYFDWYDYILIDTNPSMSVINVNALYVADSVVLSSDVSTNSVRGAELFYALWGDEREDLDKEDNVKAIILSNVDRRSKLRNDLRDYMKSNDYSMDSDMILDTMIHQTVKLKDTELMNQPVNLIHPKDKITTAYRNVVAELQKKGVF